MAALSLSPLRGADTSVVDDRHFIPLGFKVSPSLLQHLDHAAARRGLSRAEMLRQLIRSLEVDA